MRYNLANDIRRLQSFHMGCQRQILGVRWQDHVKNVDIAYTTGLPNITDKVDKKRRALFGHVHVVRLDTSVPAHQALKQVIAMKAGRCSGTNWRRLPGRPRKTWIQQIGDEQQPAGNRCGRVQRSVDIVESRRNGPHVTMMMMMMMMMMIQFITDLPVINLRTSITSPRTCKDR